MANAVHQSGCQNSGRQWCFFNGKQPTLTFWNGGDLGWLRQFSNGKLRHIYPSTQLHFLDYVLCSFILLKCNISNRQKPSSRDLIPISGIFGGHREGHFISLSFSFPSLTFLIDKVPWTRVSLLQWPFIFSLVSNVSLVW